MPRVVLEGVTKVFERGGPPIRALSNVCFSVEDRECLVVVGPSGSGKTTLLRLIGGLECLNAGTISIGNTVVSHVPPQKRDVAIVFQNPALYPHMSVSENLGLGLRLRKYSRSETASRVHEVAEALGLNTCLQARPAELSGGQRQRVAIGRALVRRASLLLLDEPLANLDPPLRAQLRQDIANVRQQFDTTMIYVTHDHFEAMLVGDRVAVLSEGEVQQVAAPEIVYRRPANLFVAQFFGFPPINLVRGILVQRDGGIFFEAAPVGRSAGQLALDPNEFPSSSAASGPSGFSLKLNVSRPVRLDSSAHPVVLGIRPEQITCVPASQLSSPAVSAVPAEIASVQMVGADLHLNVMSGENAFVIRLATPLQLAARQQCTLKFNTDSICLFDPGSGKALELA